MATHNCSRINWNLLCKSIEYSIRGYERDFFRTNNSLAIEHVAIQLFSTIKEFAETEQNTNKKRNRDTRKDKILVKFRENNINDEQLNPCTWVDNITRRNLFSGTQSVRGPIPHLIHAYVYLNLILSGWRPAYIFCIGWVKFFYSCDNNLPEFLTDEFSKIWLPIGLIMQTINPYWEIDCKSIFIGCAYSLRRRDVQKYTLTLEETEKIRDFTSLLFRCLYIFHRNYELSFIDILTEIFVMFRLDASEIAEKYDLEIVNPENIIYYED